MPTFAGIHWLRILVGGSLAELSVIAFVIPISRLFGQHSLLYVAPPASMVACFLFALWVGRRIDSRFVLHGVLVGVVATLIYVALTRAQPEPWPYLVAHALKILGGAAGGFVTGRQRNPIDLREGG
jgi:putative membrane protein (TIGR04086 family)